MDPTAMDPTEDETPLAGVDAEMKALLGLYDAPAFARRGQDLEYALARVDLRCRRERGTMLEMPRLRLRQWAALAAGPSTAASAFAAPIDGLWPLAEAPPPAWAGRDAGPRRLRAAARELVASVERFNRRWEAFLDGSNYDHVNRLIDRYNRYYVLEKECSLGSARLASRHFVPREPISRGTLIDRYPALPVPGLKT